MSPYVVRYTQNEMDRIRRIANNQLRHLYYFAPILLAVIGILLKLWWLIPIGAILSLIGFAQYRAHPSIVLNYDRAQEYWRLALARSDPRELILVPFTLQASEIVHYFEPSQRFEERRIGQVIDTHTTTQTGLGSAIVSGLLFGPAGAIIDSSKAPRRTRGTSMDIFEVIPVDHGQIALTNKRFLFLGVKSTLDLPMERILRIVALEGTNRINVEYSGRIPGESYTVDPILFALCMARRANDTGYTMPLPPAPLAEEAQEDRS